MGSQHSSPTWKPPPPPWTLGCVESRCLCKLQLVVHLCLCTAGLFERCALTSTHTRARTHTRGYCMCFYCSLRRRVRVECCSSCMLGTLAGMHAHPHTHTCTRTHTHLLTHPHTRTHPHPCISPPTLQPIHPRPPTHPPTHTHTHTHTHRERERERERSRSRCGPPVGRTCSPTPWCLPAPTN